ncbi:MAG: dienelactone hydrolase family protein [Frankiaceae bacterium]
MGEMVQFASNGSSAQGYLATPPGGSGTGIVVIQEWWGLVPHIESVCDRFAAQGYVALAPDLFHGVSTRGPDEAGKLLMGLAMDQAAKDIAGAAAYLTGRSDVTGAGVGVVGFCMGGSLALWAATLSDDVRAAVAFYPGMPWERMSPTWQRYEGKAALIHADEHEGGSAAAGIQQAAEAIRAAGGEVELADYPGTEHAFFNDDRPEVYHPQAAAEAWQRTLDFFSQRLTA